MCVEISQQQFNKMDVSNTSSNKKISYSVKKLLKQLFKQHKSEKVAHLEQFDNDSNESLESMESLENSLNASIEDDCSSSMESYENDMNESAAAAAAITVPVHFVRTEHGTYFWTAMQLQDRWAQA